MLRFNEDEHTSEEISVDDVVLDMIRMMFHAEGQEF